MMNGIKDVLASRPSTMRYEDCVERFRRRGSGNNDLITLKKRSVGRTMDTSSGTSTILTALGLSAWREEFDPLN